LSARDTDHPPGCRGVGDRDHEHARALDPQRVENLVPGRVAVKSGLPCRTRLTDGLRIQLDDEIGGVDGPQGRGEVAAIEPVAGDHDVILDGILHRRKPARAESGQHAVQRNQLLEALQQRGSALQQEGRDQHRDHRDPEC
jgi:hypothetical protein